MINLIKMIIKKENILDVFTMTEKHNTIDIGLIKCIWLGGNRERF